MNIFSQTIKLAPRAAKHLQLFGTQENGANPTMNMTT